MKQNRIIAITMIWLIALFPIVHAQSLQEPGLDTTPPEITNVQLAHGPETVITWSTNEPADSKINYAETTSIDKIATKADQETAHSLAIETTPGKTYYYKITSCDSEGNCKSTTTKTFIAGPFSVQANIPAYPRSNKIDITGTTRPGATVTIIVNNIEVRKDEIEDGEFIFKNVQLNTGKNTITVRAQLGTENAEQTYTAEVDSQPPQMNVTVDPVTTSPSVTAKIKTSEDVNLTIELAKPTGDKPPRPTGIETETITSSKVTFKWPAITNIQETAIYRDNKIIAILTPATTTYTDNTLGANKKYEYKITTINDKCIESENSETIVIETPNGNNQEQITPEKSYSCTKPKKSQALKAGTTDIKIDLNEGENLIDFTAIDKAGLKAYTQEKVIYDKGPPKFEQHNLKQLSPTYSPDVNIKGKLSEPGSVTVYINGQPKKTAPTNPDGTFDISVRLERSATITPTGNTITGGQIAVGIDTGIAWKSKVKLEAIDVAGLKANTEEVEIEYAICGSGTWLDVKLTDPTPTIINPRLLVEGLQQIGMAFEYQYKGGYKATINPRDVRVKKLTLAPEYQKDFDNGLVTVYSPPARAQKADQPKGVGYLQINFQPVQDPWQLIDHDTKAEPAPGNTTMYEKEKRISEHRKGDCLAPELGCVKLFLELEIPFQEEIETLGYLPETTGGQTKNLQNRVQRTCINVEVAIDQRIPPSVIPSGFLKGLSDVLTTGIELIDTVLKPIQTIGKYLFYTCIAGTFLSYVPIFLEKYNCEYSNVLTAVGGGEGKFDPKIAEIGACDEEYADKDEEKENCNSCQTWKENRKTYERTYRQVCDRVMCPSAPSLQYYLKTKGRQKPTQVTVTKADFSAYMDGAGGKILSGSDCAAWLIDKQKDIDAEDKKLQAQGKAEAQTTQPIRIPPRKYFTTQEIDELYEDWIDHKDDEEGEDTTEVNCAGLHPATAECCGYEYMQEWSSACGVSALGSGLDTFDEIKESACLSHEKIGQNEITFEGGETVQCNKLLNSISGFCSKTGGPTPETVRIVPFAGGPDAEGIRADLGIGTSKDQYMYLLMVPLTDKPGAQGTFKEWDLQLAYIQETIEFQQPEKGRTIEDEERHRINDKLEGIQLTQESQALKDTYFTEENKNKYYQGSIPPAVYTDFQAYLCQSAGYGGNANCGAKGKQVYDEVMGKIGEPDKEYIIKPNEGLINSVRCICFPTIIKYLQQWKQIMTAVRNCVNTILLTGDGDTGVCQAVISQYACDLLFDALACFTQKFSTGGIGRASVGTAGAGDIMGALTAAGTEMSRSTDARYGDSGMYNAVFVEKKLVHSVCMWAFTGTWDFDLGAVFDQSVDEIPIDSQALMMPCNRQFVSFNPTTRPAGLVNWLYHFGVGFIAGANVDLELHLKCSGGFKCREEDGFERGKCDCDAPRDIIIQPSELPTRVKNNEILNTEIFFTMQGSPGEGQIRYDQAYIKYRWKDGDKLIEKETTPCTIGQTGGTGSVPSFCRFEPLTFSFRCSFADQAGGIVINDIAPQYPHMIPEGVYAVNDVLNLSLQLRQDHYGKEMDNKHLEYNITNYAGQTIADNVGRELIMLTTNGDYNKIIGTNPQIMILPSWFQGGTTGQTIAAQYVQWWSKQPEARSPNNLIQNIILKKGAIESGDFKQYVLEIKNQANKNYYAVYKAGLATLDEPKTLGFVKAETVCNGELTGNTITCPDGEHTTTITLGNLRPTAEGDSYQVHTALNQKTTPTDACANKLQPQPFKIQIKIYDSDQYGTPTDQISVNPLTSNDAIYEKTFYAICAKNDDRELLAKKTGTMLPEQIIGPLKTLVEQTITTEEAFIKQLENKPTTWDPTQPGQYSQLQTELNDTITKETDAITKLTPYKTQIKPEDLTFGKLAGPLTNVTTKLQEVINSAQTAKTQIAALTVRSRDNVVPLLRPLPQAITEALGIKKTLLTEINKIIGTPGECTKGIATDGNYYECKPSCLTPFQSQPVTDKKCAGITGMCCKIPAINYCGGQSGNMKYQCSDKIEPGWMPYTIDYVSTRNCPDPTKPVCQEQSIYGTEVTQNEQLLLFKNKINEIAGKLKSYSDKYKDNSQYTDEQASVYIDQTRKSEITKEIDDIVKLLQTSYDELEAIRQRPIAEFKLSKIQQTQVTQYISAISSAKKLLNETIKTNWNAVNSPDKIKATFYQIYSTIDPLTNTNDQIKYINQAIPIKEPCPNSVAQTGWQFSCFTGTSCPTSYNFISPFNKKSIWYSFNDYSCPANQVCCYRYYQANVFHQTWSEGKYSEYIESDLSETYVNPIQPTKIQVQIPYQDTETITELTYKKVGSEPKQITNIEYATKASQKLATANIEEIIPESQTYLFEWYLNGVPKKEYTSFNVLCPTEKGPHRASSHSCTSEKCEGEYPNYAFKYKCPYLSGQYKSCCRESTTNVAGCEHNPGSSTVICKCYQNANQQNLLSGVRGTILPGQTTLEACRDVCTKKERTQNGVQYQGSAC